MYDCAMLALLLLAAPPLSLPPLTLVRWKGRNMNASSSALFREAMPKEKRERMYDGATHAMQILLAAPLISLPPRSPKHRKTGNVGAKGCAQRHDKRQLTLRRWPWKMYDSAILACNLLLAVPLLSLLLWPLGCPTSRNTVPRATDEVATWAGPQTGWRRVAWRYTRHRRPSAHDNWPYWHAKTRHSGI